MALVDSRLKREQCNGTNHDFDFSKWKMLVGPSDWEGCSKGTEGCERYRIHNLPEKLGPGVYELGIAVPGRGSEIYKLDPGRIVPVYLGKADNVRERLQHYGRTGAHLDPQNFQQIFSQGFSIVYRSAPMQNKEDALRTEAQLLRTYDYAWNTRNNGPRRPDDIRQKLNEIASGTRTKSSKVLVTDDKLDEADNGSRIFNFNRSRPRIIQEKTGIIQDRENAKICGVALGDGSICTRPPAERRERCPEHKGMRTNASTAKAIVAPKLENTGIVQDRETAKFCGVELGDGSICTRPPAEKRERCPEHKGMRTNASTAKAIMAPKLENTGIIQDWETTKFCGVELGDGSICTRPPVEKRERCPEHKGMRTNASTAKAIRAPKSTNTLVLEPEVYHRYQNVSHYVQYPPQTVFHSFTNGNICGIILNDGSTCTREPVQGRKRCHRHKGMRLR